jgi:hypothetical protein
MSGFVHQVLCRPDDRVIGRSSSLRVLSQLLSETGDGSDRVPVSGETGTPIPVFDQN